MSGKAMTGGAAYDLTSGEVSVFPATAERFDDLAVLLAPKTNPDGDTCWCITYRLPAAENQTLRGCARRERMREFTQGATAPGVLAYVSGQVAGWAALGPKTELVYNRSRGIPHLDDAGVWSLYCLKVRPGFRQRGLTAALIEGAAEYARSQGAPAIEAYPTDNRGAKVDQTMAYVGTRDMFERAGFQLIAPTERVSGGFPRMLMRCELRGTSDSGEQSPVAAS
ncbi:MAG: GNAT family N-acetyltransferase [Propionibacteriaceae bacterium]|nr:GNAT family N-acetyltransferase [Propionibacteriaceae bacterium]